MVFSFILFYFETCMYLFSKFIIFFIYSPYCKHMFCSYYSGLYPLIINPFWYFYILCNVLIGEFSCLCHIDVDKCIQHNIFITFVYSYIEKKFFWLRISHKIININKYFIKYDINTNIQYT